MESSDSGGKVDHVSISIREEENQGTPAAAANPQLKFYFAVLSGLTLFFMFLLVLFPAMFQHERQSTFKTRGGFFIIIAVVSLSVAILASAILIFTSHCFQSLMKDIHYTIFKCIGYFTATTASFCLIVVLFVPLNLNPWIAYPVICILFTANVFACYFLWKHVCSHQPDDDKFPVHFLPAAPIFFTPVLVMVMFAFVASGLRWIRYMVLCLNLTILVASCFVTAYMTLIYGRKQLGTSSSDLTRRPDHQSSSAIRLAT